jgi:hypothetical protein
MKRWSRFIGIGLALAFVAAIVAALPGSTSTVDKLVHNVLHNYLLFTGALGALGTLTMAVIQTIKDLVPVLRWYQQIKTRQWLALRAAEASKVHTERRLSPRAIVKERLERSRLSFARLAPELHQDLYPPFDKTDEDVAIEAEADLLRLAAAGNRMAFYDLPIEQLCGQMNTASQAVLDYPERHLPLLKCLASLAEEGDISEYTKSEDRLKLEALRKKSPREEKEQKEYSRLQQHFADLRGPIANQIHRNIDAFQIDVGDRWKWYLRMASYLVSFGITAIALDAGVGRQWINSGSCWDKWEAVVLIGLIGGFLAPVTSDIQAILRQFRQTT